MSHEPEDILAKVRARIEAGRDDRAFRLSVAENVTANGRLLIILLAAANYAAGQPIGVAMAAVPVAFAWASDLSGLAGKDALQRHCSRASVGTAIGLVIATLVNCW